MMNAVPERVSGPFDVPERVVAPGKRELRRRFAGAALEPALLGGV
jgi:hypothetical protein